MFVWLSILRAMDFFFVFFGEERGGGVHIGSGKHFLYSALLYRNLHPNLIGNLVHN